MCIAVKRTDGLGQQNTHSRKAENWALQRDDVMLSARFRHGTVNT